jgi:glycosyltransferase involved in cell wall biosynthesis
LFCLDQAKALASLGHEVRILSNVQVGATVGWHDYLTLPFSRYEHQMDGIMVYQSYQRGIPKSVRYNVKRWVAIVHSMFGDYIKRYGRPDILHAHCAKWAGYAAMQIGKEYGIPYVVTEHLPLMLLEKEFGKAPSHAWQIAPLKKTYEKAGMVIPVSEELVDDISCYYGKDYRWQYVSNTIDTDFFCYQQRAPRHGRPFRFCCIADYSHRKGYDILFAAYQQLQKRGHLLELHVAGQQTDSEAFRHEIELLKLKNVKAYGRISKQEIRDLLLRSDALVLASRGEVQPLVLLEAMSMGIPVVSTECIPHSLRIEGGCTIVPVDDAHALADAMEELITGPLVDGLLLSAKVSGMASPKVVGEKLAAIMSDVVAAFRQS